MLTIYRIEAAGDVVDPDRVASGAAVDKGWWHGDTAERIHSRVGDATVTDVDELIAWSHQFRTDQPPGAFVLQFRAPSAFSLLAIANQQAGLECFAAHDYAVSGALLYLETAIAEVQENARGDARESITGFATAYFRDHAGDDGLPLLHTNVITIDAVITHGNHWSAIDERLLHAFASAVGFAYRAALEKDLSTRLPDIPWRGPAEDRDVALPPEIVEQIRTLLPPGAELRNV